MIESTWQRPSLLAALLNGLMSLVVSITVAFFALRVLPFDAISIQLMESGAPPDAIAARREALGFDDPIIVQYLRYVAGLAQGDLGVSLLTGQPVQELILYNLGETLQLALSSLTFGAIVGVTLGAWGTLPRIDGVMRQGGASNSAIASKLRILVSTLALSTPTYWTGTLVIWLFAVRLDWFPASGGGGWEHLVLPTLVLGFSIVGGVAAVTATLLRDVSRQDFVRTGLAKGLPERIVTYRHAVRVILPGVVTHLGTQAIFVLGGAVVTETVFARPGLGRLLLDAALRHDYPVVQGVVVWTSGIVVVVTFLGVMARRRLDPRPIG
jgi:ABC-type dipeptide/oligopeptide/nickel transport system permease component